MKFSQRTNTILKNFNAINGSLEFTEGNKLSTMSVAKTIVATATITETIDKSFCIYDLSKFLSTLSLFDEYKIEFFDKYLILNDGKTQAKYHFCDPTIITKPPKNHIDLPTVDLELTLSNEHLTAIQKAADILSLPEIAFVGDGSRIIVTSIDSKGITNDSFSIDLGETDKTFKAVFKRENLKMLSDNYEVKISKKGLAQFTASDIIYWLPIEAKSSEFSE